MKYKFSYFECLFIVCFQGYKKLQTGKFGIPPTLGNSYCVLSQCRACATFFVRNRNLFNDRSFVGFSFNRLLMRSKKLFFAYFSSSIESLP